MEKHIGMTYQCANNPPDFSFIMVSEGCGELFGYTRDELTAAGAPALMQLVYPEDAAALLNLHNITLCVGLTLDTTFRAKTKEGAVKQIWLRARVAEMDDVGMPSVFEGFCMDVTNLLRAETSKIINREKVGFLTRISHEIRTPMNSIIGMAELSLNEETSEKQRSRTSSIRGAGDKLMSALTAIEDYGKIEAGELELFPEEYSLSSVIKGVTNTVAEQVKDKPLEFWAYADSKLPDLLVGDALRLRQIMLNLLSNAVKFSDDGIVILTIGGEVSGNSVNLQITVEDSGRGIKQEDMGELFTPYSQFDSKSIEGLGLGLTITRSLTEAMGGEIQISSLYGLGSAASVTIPQEIRSGEAICEIYGTHELLIYDNRITRMDFIAKTLDNLGLRYKTVSAESEFHKCLAGGGYTFAFTADELHKAFIKKYPGLKSKVKIERISMPLYCLPLAEILNGEKPAAQIVNKVDFTAPEVKILLVDDVEANLLVLQGLLEPYKMRFDAFTSAAEAIEAVKLTRYDLILMDHVMPVMDGLEATAQIRGLPPRYPTDCKNVPIIAVTASAMPGIREMFLKSGFNDFVSKPVDVRLVNAAIAKWLPAAKKITVAIEGEPPAPQTDLELQGVNIEKGIEMSGGKAEFYLDVLKLYYENALKLRGLLKECLETGDTGLYRIHVHAVKSSSGNIGADGLFKLASALEDAAARNDTDFLQAASPSLFSALDILLNDIYEKVINKANTRYSLK